MHISNSWASENGNKTVWLILWASMWISVFTLSSHFFSKTAIIAANYRPQRQTMQWGRVGSSKNIDTLLQNERLIITPRRSRERNNNKKKSSKVYIPKGIVFAFFPWVFLTQVSIYCFSSKVCTNDPVLFIRLRKMHCHMTTFLNKHVTSWTNNNNRAGPIKWR